MTINRRIILEGVEPRPEELVPPKPPTINVVGPVDVRTEGPWLSSPFVELEKRFQEARKRDPTLLQFADLAEWYYGVSK